MEDVERLFVTAMKWPKQRFVGRYHGCLENRQMAEMSESIGGTSPAKPSSMFLAPEAVLAVAKCSAKNGCARVFGRHGRLTPAAAEKIVPRPLRFKVSVADMSFGHRHSTHNLTVQQLLAALIVLQKYSSDFGT